MNKDVIYIDVEDDITAIIGKIKSSKEKIIALVPPKRAGVLQSAINLRLLDRMATTNKKRLVIITNNQALIALSASAHIPVAKNLQSKPEIAQIPALSVDDGDDIIDGSEIPVGDHAKSVSKDTTDVSVGITHKPSRNETVEALAIDGEAIATGIDSIDNEVTPTSRKADAKNKVKIPNFNTFRKRLFFLILGGGLLTALLIWMFVFAPAATIVITASTTPAPVSATVKLGGTAATDVKTGVIRSVSQQLKKDESVDFDATGEKDLGTKATGTVELSTNSISALGTVIKAGTVLTTNAGLSFTTDADVTMTINNYNGADVAVTATESGTDSNGATGNLTGAPSGISAAFSTAAAGGTSKIVKAVSADDIERAKGQLIGQSTDAVKKELTKKFTNGEKVIDSSFTVERGDATATPAVDQEAPATGKAKLVISTTYTIYAIPKGDLETYLNDALKQQIDNAKTQRVYNNGVDGVGLSNFVKTDQTMTVTITAKGQIGPQIDDAAVKEQVKGKITGDVQSALSTFDGITNVDVEYSYFWVRNVPNNTNKIQIQFKIQNDQ